LNASIISSRIIPLRLLWVPLKGARSRLRKRMFLATPFLSPRHLVSLSIHAIIPEALHREPIMVTQGFKCRRRYRRCLLGSSSSGYNQRRRQREQEHEHPSSSDPQQPQMMQRQCLDGQMDHQRANSGSEKGAPLYLCLAVVVQYKPNIVVKFL
jgi:hypothetical protein